MIFSRLLYYGRVYKERVGKERLVKERVVKGRVVKERGLFIFHISAHVRNNITLCLIISIGKFTLASLSASSPSATLPSAISPSGTLSIVVLINILMPQKNIDCFKS